MSKKNIVSIILLGILFVVTSAFSTVVTYNKINVENTSPVENKNTIYLGNNTFEIVNNSGKSIKDIDVVSDKAVVFDDLQASINKKETANLHFEGEIKDINQLFDIKVTFDDDSEKQLVNLPLKMLKSATIQKEDDLIYVDYVLLTDKKANTKDTELAIKEEEDRIAAEEAARLEAERIAAEQAAAQQAAAQQAAAQQAAWQAQQATYSQPVYQQPVAEPVQSVNEGCLGGALFND